MANFIFNSARKLFSKGAIDWTSNTMPSGSLFTNYKIMAALVNKSGGSGMQNYTPPSDPNNDNVDFVAGVSRNMLSDFGFGNTEANSSLIRDASGTVITAELTNRTLIAATGACDADDITFPNVPVRSTYGNIEGIVIYLKNESPGASTDGSDWPVLVFIDTLQSGAMNLAPNGGDVIVVWSSSGIFRL